MKNNNKTVFVVEESPTCPVKVSNPAMVENRRLRVPKSPCSQSTS